MSDLDAAARAFEQLRTRNLRLGNVFESNKGTLNLAELEHERGHSEKAVALVHEVLPALRDGRDRSTLLNALANLCGYLVALNRPAEALAFARETFRKSVEHDRGGVFVSWAIEHAALAVALEGEVRRSAQLAGYTDAAFSRVGYVREYTEQTTRSRHETLLRERLVPSELDALLANGAEFRPEDAIALALESSDAGE